MKIGLALLLACAVLCTGCTVSLGTKADYKTSPSSVSEITTESEAAGKMVVDLASDNSILETLLLIGEEDMNTEVINNADVNNINVASTGAAIIIEPATDENIKLMFSSRSDFHVSTEVSDGVLNIQAKADIIKNYSQSDYVLKIHIPESLINQLDIVSSAAFVHITGKDNLLQSCSIDVIAGAFCLENIYADTVVKTITGAIKLKNETIKSNIRLGTQIGVVDIALGELPDNVSIRTSGTVKRNTFLRTRSAVSTNKQYVVEAKSQLGVINIH